MQKRLLFTAHLKYMAMSAKSVLAEGKVLNDEIFMSQDLFVCDVLFIIILRILLKAM